MRYLFGFLCICALGVVPVAGCGETTGDGGSGGSAGSGGSGGGMGDVFPCTEQGVRDAIAEGGGPHTFNCGGPATVVTEAEIVIDNDVVLDGGGDLLVDGNDDHRVFSVARGVTVGLVGLTVTGGFGGSGPKSVSSGAGIRNEGTLTLTTSTVTGNTIDWGGGGGIDNRGLLTLTRTTVSDNSVLSVASDGGGILNSGTLTITNSTVSGNTSPVLDECTGSGISNWGTLTITNSTVSGPPAPPCLIRNAGTLAIKSSVVDGGCEGDIASGGYNVESPGDTCDFDEGSDRVSVSAGDLKLGRLTDNGGPTETHALRSGSLATNVIPAAMCEVDEDQRSVTRPQGVGCDVGAFELEVAP